MIYSRFFRLILTLCLVCIISTLFANTAKAQCPPNDPNCSNWQAGAFNITLTNVNGSCDAVVYYCYRLCNNQLQVFFSSIRELSPGCFGNKKINFKDPDIQRQINELMFVQACYNSSQILPPCAPPPVPPIIVTRFNAPCYHYILAPVDPQGNRELIVEACTTEIGCTYQYTACIGPLGKPVFTFITETSYSIPCTGTFHDIDMGNLYPDCFSLCD